jgi:hypothetical protein
VDVTWQECIALIGMHVDAKFIPIVKNQKLAHQVWSELKKAFTLQSGAVILNLKTQFYKCHLEAEESLSAYLDRVLLITEKLRGLGCETAETEICFKILSSLSEKYRSMTMAIMVLPIEKLTISFLRSQFSLDSTLGLPMPNESQALPASSKPTRFPNRCSQRGMANTHQEGCKKGQEEVCPVCSLSSFAMWEF